MSIIAKIVLDLGIIVLAFKLDNSGYAGWFSLAAIVRYELGPMLNS